MAKNLDINTDTLVALQRAQAERERQIREQQKVAAAEFIDWYGPRHDWSEEDVLLVKQALGVDHDRST